MKKLKSALFSEKRGLKEGQKLTRIEVLQRARKSSLERMTRGRRAFYNFDYRVLWEIFREKNWEAIEREEDSASLLDFVKENCAFSRAILPRKLNNDGIYASLSYEQRTKLAFYALLTVLQRVGRNYIKQIEAEEPYSLSEMFSFEMVPTSIKVEQLEREEVEWIKEAMRKEEIL